MAVSKEDREAYEKGQQDGESGIVGALISGLCLDIGRATSHGYTGSQLNAYEKGLNGKQLDE